MSEYYAVINGVTHELSRGEPLTVKAVNGKAVPEVKPLTERGPLQDGDTDNDFRVEARIIMIQLQAARDVVAGWSYANLCDYVDRIFRPSNVPIRFGYRRDNGTTREIVVRSLGGNSVEHTLESELHFDTVVPLRAADPFWYDPAGVSISFGVGGGGTGFVVPTPVPSFIGASTLDQLFPIHYDGTYKDYPIIKIYGPITDPVITNLTTDRVISFAGITIEAGDWYTVDLRYGRKRVYRNGVETDIRTHEAIGDLATFALEADAEAPNGINDIHVTGTTINAATQIYIDYFNRYVGA